jgi:cell division transport system permease protein
MLTQFKRVFDTAVKDLKRHKAITFSSIAVMTLVFLVFSIFSFFAYSATKFFNYVETREHLEVFFNTDVPESQILEIKQTLEYTQKTAYIEYTTQEQAADFLRERHSDNELILGAINPESLPASLAIRAKKIEYVKDLNSILLTQDTDGTLIYKIGYNEDTTNLLKDLLFWVRLVGGVLFTILVIVMFLVSLIAVEISMTLRSEEISIMHLVGGGKWFIRAPFIVQGAIYGIIGAFVATTILVGTGVLFYFVKDHSPTLSFLSNFFSDLDWPSINPLLLIGIFLGEVVLGGFVGSVNSLFAVFRRLK